ncbi:hypothetical protein EGT39_01280 [Escherichia coli]|nr:hypothetical protein EGT39_01280 [Escherichia coli]
MLHNFLPFFLIADGKIPYQQFHFSSVSSQSATVKWHFDYSWRFDFAVCLFSDKQRKLRVFLFQ